MKKKSGGYEKVDESKIRDGTVEGRERKGERK